ncbi:MAG: succinate dehydrogenase cytochrome b subunit [Deltaproteobacteria bacterium]|nr:succinate dehydrogenase cytochrome b subunit [Deltaproteobacteria bacterium]
MSWLLKTFTSHTGRKAIAALTGLGLVLFLTAHLIGNLQIYSSSSAFDDYAKSLHGGPLIVFADVGLMIAFPLHVIAVIWLARDNRKARGDAGYKVAGSKQKRGLAAVLASKTTLYGGIVLLVFTVIHVIQFRLRHDEIGGKLKDAVIDTLDKPHWAALYIVGSLVVGWHLFHGFQAAFRSLGVWHGRYTPMLTKIGLGVSLVIALGFASIPVWIIVT